MGLKETLDEIVESNKTNKPLYRPITKDIYLIPASESPQPLDEAINEFEDTYGGLDEDCDEDSLPPIKEDIAWMEGDVYDEGYWYNTITGKVVQNPNENNEV